MPLLAFMDMIRDQQYPHVSMNMLESFMNTCKTTPKCYYLHYYLYFLYYALHYHNIRSQIDVIDEKMKEQHLYHLKCIQIQIKFLQNIIKQLGRAKGHYKAATAQ